MMMVMVMIMHDYGHDYGVGGATNATRIRCSGAGPRVPRVPGGVCHGGQRHSKPSLKAFGDLSGEFRLRAQASDDVPCSCPELWKDFVQQHVAAPKSHVDSLHGPEFLTPRLVAFDMQRCVAQSLICCDRVREKPACTCRCS